MTIPRTPYRRATRILAVLLLLAGVGVIAAYAGRDQISEIVVPPAENSTPVPAAVSISPEEQAFYGYAGARLRALTAEAAVLVKLGDERSRNLVELQVRGDRVIELADQIDTFIAENTIPARFMLAVDLYRTGVEAARTGISNAKSAVLRFDWDAVATALESFENGTNQLQTTYIMLRDIVGDAATPAGA